MKRLYLSSTDKKIAGVCGGIAEYFEIAPTIVRLFWLISVFVFGTGVLIYFIAAILIPEKEEIGGTINLEKDKNGTYRQENAEYNKHIDEDKNRKVMAFSLIAIGIFLFIKRLGLFHWLNFKFLFPILLVLAGIIVLFNNSKK